jgi:cyclophilin family peptidyl-prolyl cis-trans isomerase
MSRTLALFVCLYLAFLSSVQAGILAQFRTVFGDMDVELFEKDKPITVSNFVAYVNSGRYRDAFVHRLNPTFVVQGGGFYVANRGTANAAIDYVQTFPPIRNEYGAGNVYSNAYGTIAMAKQGGNTNSATSQWFINLANNYFLDTHDDNNYFTVFGRVVRGTNVLNKLRSFTYWQGTSAETNIIADFSLTVHPAFGEWPFLTSHFTYSDILYVDISLLNVHVQNIAGAPEISWNSVTGKVNRVEFTTNMPPAWNTLVTTNGTGANMTVRDSSTAPSRRFYRVTVDY